LLVSALAAQQPKEAPSGPVPAKIRTARKAFVANAGGDEMYY
jgi:hypothetical protein